MFGISKEIYLFLIICLNIHLFQVQCSDDVQRDISLDKKAKQKINGKIKNKLTDEPIVLTTCGRTHVKEDGVGDKIIGGFEAKEGQFPYQVLLRLRRRDGRVMICGGSILNSLWILTAAHCVSNERSGDPYVDSIELMAGTVNKEDRSEKVQRISIECVIQHEKWVGLKGGFANDLALLRLPNNNQLNITYKNGGNVNGICLPMRAKSPFEYTGKARISGWGVTTSKGGKSSVVLRYTDVGLIEDKHCLKNSFPFSIVDSMLCQGIDRTSPCFGDSGGPLVVRMNGRYTQLGVVSTGPSHCANAADPNGIYTQISYFLDWIEDTISRNSRKWCFGYRLKKF